MFFGSRNHKFSQTVWVKGKGCLVWTVTCCDLLTIDSRHAESSQCSLDPKLNDYMFLNKICQILMLCVFEVSYVCTNEGQRPILSQWRSKYAYKWDLFWSFVNFASKTFLNFVYLRNVPWDPGSQSFAGMIVNGSWKDEAPNWAQLALIYLGWAWWTLIDLDCS